MANLTLNTARFQLTTDQVEAAVVRARRPKAADRTVWKQHTIGPATVRYGQTKWYDKKRDKTYTAWTIAWRDSTGRHREKRNTKARAIARAEQLATQLCNGGTALLEFGPADQASLLRAREILAKVGAPPLETVAEVYAESLQALGLPLNSQLSTLNAALKDACRTWAAANPAGQARRTSAQVLDELLSKRKLCSKWQRMLKKMLERFTEKFPEPISELQPRPLADWLDSLKSAGGQALGLRTRRNYLRAVLELANFAQDRGYLPKAWDVLDHIDDPEPAPTAVNLYTPDELVHILNKAETTKAGAKLVPLIAITAFAGVRHGEMNEEKIEALDWADFDWDAKRIHIDAAAAKRTGRSAGDDRTVDMPDNLVAWLTPYRRKTGKICELANTSNALCRLRTKCSIKGPKKNALRKSFITYKLALTRDIAGVADQAGNSAAVIRKNYKAAGHTRMRELAARWFNIVPTRADVLPLFSWKAKTA